MVSRLRRVLLLLLLLLVMLVVRRSTGVQERGLQVAALGDAGGHGSQLLREAATVGDRGMRRDGGVQRQEGGRRRRGACWLLLQLLLVLLGGGPRRQRCREARPAAADGGMRRARGLGLPGARVLQWTPRRAGRRIVMERRRYGHLPRRRLHSHASQPRNPAARLHKYRASSIAPWDAENVYAVAADVSKSRNIDAPALRRYRCHADAEMLCSKLLGLHTCGSRGPAMPPGARDPVGPSDVDGAGAGTSQSLAATNGEDAATGAPTALDEGSIGIGGLPPALACTSR